MQQRQKDFNYDIVGGRFSMALAPGLELRQIFGSAAADAAGSANYGGIEKVIAAPERPTMEARVRALDRVLRAKQIWVPNWYSGQYLVAYWDVFGRPDIQPEYARGDAYWWIDQAKYDKLKSEGALR